MATLEQRLKDQGVSAQDTAGIKPLLDNKTFRADAEGEIALLQDASDKATALAKSAANYDAEVMLFLTATRSIAEIEKKFPEASDEVAKIKTLLADAMSKVHHNPVKPAATAPTTTAPTAPAAVAPAAKSSAAVPPAAPKGIPAIPAKPAVEVKK